MSRRPQLAWIQLARHSGCPKLLLLLLLLLLLRLLRAPDGASVLEASSVRSLEAVAAAFLQRLAQS